MRGANLGLRFLLELCLLAAFGYWAFGAGGGGAGGALLAAAVILAVCVIWGLFISPKARFQLGLAAWLVVQLGLFVLGAAALWSAGQGLLGLALLAVFLANLAVLYRLGEVPSRPPRP
jgi:hypothetical protein